VLNTIAATYAMLVLDIGMGLIGHRTNCLYRTNSNTGKTIGAFIGRYTYKWFQIFLVIN
jgi:hypothetical protein